MVSYKSLSLLALAGSTIAAPHRGRPGRVVWETVIKTVYATVEPGQPIPTEAAEPVTSPAAPPAYPTNNPAPPKPSSSKVVVITTPAPAPPPAPTSEAPAPAPPASSAAPAPPPSSGGGKDNYMALVDEYRAKLGLKALKRDTALEGNCAETVRRGGSVMKHWLGPGSMGQVLAPGGTGDFEHCFVGGWLCEIPTLPGLDGVCQTASNGWDYQGQTGHAEILTDTSYDTIGCATNEHVWCCDLGRN